MHPGPESIFDPEARTVGPWEEFMGKHRRRSAFLLAAGLAILCGGDPPALAATGECVAEITAELKGQQKVDGGIRLRFEVELTSKTACISATYDMILVELLPNGQWKSVRLTRRIELTSGAATDLVEHVMASDLKLLEHEARVVECAPCKNP